MTTFSLYKLWPDFSCLYNGEIWTSPGLAALFVAITALFFLVFLAVAVFQLLRSRRKYCFYRKHIEEAKATDLAASRRNLLRDAGEKEKQEEWPEIWNEFDETLVEVDGQLKNTVEASHFFNASSLAGGLVGNRWLAAGSGIITGLGVLGTFVGLQLGLGSLVFDNGTDKLMQGIQQLVGSASIAFTTSVWGVLLSLIFNFSEKVLEQHARNRIGKLQSQIDKLFPRFSPSEILRNIRDDSRQSRETLQGLAERIGDRMQEAVSSVSESIQTGLEDSPTECLGPCH